MDAVSLGGGRGSWLEQLLYTARTVNEEQEE
jgi:hypothetical protein